MRTEDIRDANGKFLGTRVFEVDKLGREVFADVTTDQAVGVSFDTVVSAVVDQLRSGAAAGTLMPSAPSTQVSPATAAPALSTAQVTATARGKGSKK